jgi:drug/metabolite transporter (DMT)-like permease
VIAVFGGLVAALSWGITTLSGSRASRIAGAGPALSWTIIVGTLVLVPAILVSGRGTTLTAAALFWVAVAGFGNVVGLLLEYRGFRYGPVGLIASIASCEGLIASAISLLAGASASWLLLLTVPVLTTGLVLVMMPDAAQIAAAPSWSAASMYAAGAALTFGASLYATAQIAGSLPLVWAVLPSRLVGMVVLVLPLLATSKLRIPRAATPWVVAAGLAEVVGFTSFALASRHNVLIAAVLASQFGVVATVGAAVGLHERLRARQWFGVSLVGVGVALVAASSASG